jgi:hypothetical protein
LWIFPLSRECVYALLHDAGPQTPVFPALLHRRDLGSQALVTTWNCASLSGPMTQLSFIDFDHKQQHGKRHPEANAPGIEQHARQGNMQCTMQVKARAMQCVLRPVRVNHRNDIWNYRAKEQAAARTAIGPTWVCMPRVAATTPPSQHAYVTNDDSKAAARIAEIARELQESKQELNATCGGGRQARQRT